MFDERKAQWFCKEEQHAAQQGKPAPWNMQALPEKHWEEPFVVCGTDADCPRPDLGQACTRMFWDAVIDGSSFANGAACYNRDTPVCPGPPFAQVNYNY